MTNTKNCPYCGEEILLVARKCKHCGEWLETTNGNQPSAPPVSPTPPTPPISQYSPQPAYVSPSPVIVQSGGGKSKGVALILCFFFPGLGICNLYLGNTAMGILGLIFGGLCYATAFLLLPLLLIPLFIGFIHFIVLLCTSEADFNRKYNHSIQEYIKPAIRKAPPHLTPTSPAIPNGPVRQGEPVGQNATVVHKDKDTNESKKWWIIGIAAVSFVVILLLFFVNNYDSQNDTNSDYSESDPTSYEESYYYEEEPSYDEYTID